MADWNFSGLAAALLSNSQTLCENWLPGGKIVGKEYVCGNEEGGKGRSFSVNLHTGKWSDFSKADVCGGDLISLYALINDKRQGEAAKILSEELGFDLGETKQPVREAKPVKVEPLKPPTGTKPPNMSHHKHGEPTGSWEYKGEEGETLFYIARYDGEEGKQFVPYTWDGVRWVRKAWPEPRPLYGLELLKKHPDRQVLVVEGEKACDAAREIVGRHMNVVSWPNGSKSYKKVDWAPLHGKSVLGQPDADDSGVDATQGIATILHGNAKEVKIIDISDHNGGWDMADALDEAWDYDRWLGWAKPRATVFAPTIIEKAVIENIEKAVINMPPPDTDLLSQSVYAIQESLGIPKTKAGTAICNSNAIGRVLRRLDLLKGSLWYDSFYQRMFTNWEHPSGHGTREWADTDTAALEDFLQGEIGMTKVSYDACYRAVDLYGLANVRNEPADWMKSLVWDKTPRLEEFFMRGFGAEESDYARRASLNWWVTMAARIMRPGCKVDNMIVLESGQGNYKSTALDIIGGKWFTEAHESVTSKDFYLSMTGKLIVEIAELDSFSKAEINTIKKVITCKVDRYRSPFGRASADHPRQCVFVGTTNEDAYLRDHTGARRFWPIKCHRIDITYIEENRSQLFAEAVVKLNEGVEWWEMPGDETKDQQERRREGDEWETLISDWLTNKAETRMIDVALQCLKIEPGRFDLTAQRRIGRVLRSLRWAKHNLHCGGGAKQEKVWRAPNFYFQDPPF